MVSFNDVTLQQLRCFVAVADHEQFTSAAAALELTQPSLSAQVAHLEKALGVTVFRRDRRPIQLTSAGHELLPLARRVLSSLGDVLHGAAEVEGLRRGQVTVGVTPSLNASLLPAVLARFHAHYPGVAMTIVETDSDDLAERLEAGSLDLALVMLPLARPTLSESELGREELVVVVAKNHALATRRSITPRDLDGVAMIMFRHGYDLRSATTDALVQAGATPVVALDGAEMGSVLHYVAAGLGVAIVPSIVAAGQRDVAVLRLTNPRLERIIGIAQPRDATLSRAAHALRDEITAFLEGTQWPVKVFSR